GQPRARAPPPDLERFDGSVAAVTGRADLEPVEASGRRHPDDLDAVHDGTHRPASEELLESVELLGWAFDHAADAAVQLVRDPAGEAEPGGLAEHGIAEPDALDAPADRRLE